MNRRWTIVIAAAVIGYAVHAFAQVRTDMRPPVMPITSSSSNGVSFAWFYDPADRSVVVCRAGATDAVDCKARATLP